MARASVHLTCQKCGKEFTHIKYYLHNSQSRESYEKWAKETIDTCPDCWKAEQEAKKLAEREKQIAESAKSASGCPWALPALEGSEKQIKWATDIRNNLIAQLVDKGAKWDVMEAIGKGDKPEGASEEVLQAASELYKTIYNASSKWWIDNRGKQFANHCFEIGKGMR